MPLGRIVLIGLLLLWDPRQQQISSRPKYLPTSYHTWIALKQWQGPSCGFSGRKYWDILTEAMNSSIRHLLIHSKDSNEDMKELFSPFWSLSSPGLCHTDSMAVMSNIYKNRSGSFGYLEHQQKRLLYKRKHFVVALNLREPFAWPPLGKGRCFQCHL